MTQPFGKQNKERQTQSRWIYENGSQEQEDFKNKNLMKIDNECVWAFWVNSFELLVLLTQFKRRILKTLIKIYFSQDQKEKYSPKQFNNFLFVFQFNAQNNCFTTRQAY